jgi:serine/threonine-protein kinase
VRDPLGLRGHTLLDRYEVEEPIARGGMAVIYRGLDRRLCRPVCIKVFHRFAAGPLGQRAAYQHFVQEAFALSQFSHPHTLRIYDFGYADDQHQAPFQISEWLDGGTLAQRIAAEGPLAVDGALEILEPVAGALAEAHARGIIHRDIKPSNILFASAGHTRVVKLCDFGIAEMTAADAPHRAEDTRTASGQRLRLYSPGWCAPEQLRGGVCGPTSDVFALGLVMAFVLTGDTMFPHTLDAEAIAARRDSDAHVDRFLERHGVPARIALVVRRACREAPAERFASVDELADAMQAAARAPARGSSPPPFSPRRMHTVPIAGGEQIDLGGESPHLRSPARFRITIQPSRAGVPRLHVKGLNCFVVLVEGDRRTRPTTAIDLDRDGQVEFVAADRRVLDGVRCVVRPDQVVLDPGPDRVLTVLTPRR